MRKNLPVFETGRGGRYTYHGPGQRVIYALCDLRKNANATCVRMSTGWKRMDYPHVLDEFGIAGRTAQWAHRHLGRA